MRVLVDSSVWIDYFRGSNETDTLDHLIDNGLVIINDLILAELVPPLILRKQQQVISILNAIDRVPMSIDWRQLIDMQVMCIQEGINKVGIPDLIIAQNAIANSLKLHSHDKHFKLMSSCVGLSLY